MSGRYPGAILDEKSLVGRRQAKVDSWDRVHLQSQYHPRRRTPLAFLAGLQACLAQSTQDVRGSMDGHERHDLAQNPESIEDCAVLAVLAQLQVLQVRPAFYPPNTDARSRQSQHYLQGICLAYHYPSLL